MDSGQNLSQVDAVKPFWKTKKALALYAIVIVLFIIIIVIIVVVVKKKDANTTPALTGAQQCALLGAYWNASEAKCYAEPPPEVTQMTLQQSCERGGGFWSNSNAQCLNEAPASVVITGTGGGTGSGTGGTTDPRIACLQGGGMWNEVTRTCDATPTIGPKPVVGQFVRIERATGSEVINLGELAVYGPNNQSLIPGATITAGSTYYGMYPPANLIDSQIYTFAHTDPEGPPYTNTWMELNLGTNKEISQVVITNRQDCCQDRAIGLRLVIKNTSGATVYASPAIDTEQNVYTFDTIV